MNSVLKPKIRFKGFTEEWEQRKLDDFGIATGGTSIESEFSENGKYKVISIGSYSESSTYNDQGIRAIHSDKTKIRVLNKDDLTMILNDKTASGRIIGRVLYIDKSGKYVYNQRTERIEIDNNLYNSKFVYHMLNAPNIRNKIIKQSQGNTQIFVNWTGIKNTEYEIPNLKEQESLAKLFDSIDNLITLHQRKCDKLVELKKSLLEKMFPQNNSTIPAIRFKGFTEDWEQRKLSDNLKSIQTGTNLLGSIDNLGTPLLKMRNIQRGYFATDKIEYLKDYCSIEKQNIANFGDFFFNTRNTLELVGKGATWFGISGKYAFNSNIARFDFDGINTKFFNYLYNTESLLKQVHSRATGTTSVAAIYPQSLNTIEYMLPTYDEQSKIGSVLLNLDNLITLHQRKHDKLNKIKQSLLNNMFV